MGTLAIAALFGIFAGSGRAADCAPARLTHIVVRNVTPGVDPLGFQGAPRSHYRLGARSLRSETEDDVVRRVREVTVVAEPDVWVANLNDGTGVHLRDPGPTYFAHAPLFIGAGVSPSFTKLEFGCEAEFLRDNHLKVVRVDVVDAVAYDVYRLEGVGDAIEILQKRRDKTPTFARYFHGRTLGLSWRYELYDRNAKVAPALFAPVKGVRYVDRSVKPERSADGN